MQPCPKETPGTLWFKTATPFEYFNEAAKTREARSQDGSMSTVGDVGYVDDDGFLYLTDRATFMIVCGGVNIYPQGCENLLITHRVAFGRAKIGTKRAKRAAIDADVRGIQVRVDVVVRGVAVLSLANNVGQRADLVQRRRGLVKEQTVLKAEPTAGEDVFADSIKAESGVHQRCKEEK